MEHAVGRLQNRGDPCVQWPGNDLAYADDLAVAGLRADAPGEVGAAVVAT